jgi:hypothetical protein
MSRLARAATAHAARRRARNRAGIAVAGGAAFFVSAVSAVCAGPRSASARDRPAQTDEKEACIAAAENGQSLRDDQKYRLARDAFSRCSRDTCPAVVRQDCAQWLEGLDDRSPTIVIGARDANGHDLSDVRVTIDGLPLVTRLDGRSVNVDPGTHVLRYEIAGFAPVEQSVVIAGGEKDRLVGAAFGKAATAARTADDTPPLPVATLAPPPVDPLTEPEEAPGPPPAAWIFAGVAVAAFASEAAFGLTATLDRDADLAEGGCAPHCGQAEVDWIRTRSVIADASLAVGLVSAGLATYFFVAPRGQAKKTIAASIDVGPRPGGAFATIGGRF